MRESEKIEWERHTERESEIDRERGRETVRREDYTGCPKHSAPWGISIDENSASVKRDGCLK